MKNTANQTAAETYAKRAAEMRIHLSALTAWLDQRAPKPEDANWGDVADLAKVNSQLEDILEFLGRDNY